MTLFSPFHTGRVGQSTLRGQSTESCSTQATGAGGGIIRDIMVGTVPRVLRKQIYFTAALAGAVCYITLLPYLPEFWNMLLAVAVICVIRGLAFHYRWNLPRAKQAEFDE